MTRKSRIARGTDATPERLAKAQDKGETLVSRAGVRLMVDPLSRLAHSHQLCRDDPVKNAVMMQAGEIFRAHWSASHFDGACAIDYSRDRVSGLQGGGTTDRAQFAQKTIAQARAAVGEHLWEYLVAVVIDERPISDIAIIVRDVGGERHKSVLALERVRESLQRLVMFYGITRRLKTIKQSSFRSEKWQPTD